MLRSIRHGLVVSLLLSIMLLCPQRVDSGEDRPGDRPKWGPILLYSSLHAGDLITTEIGLSRGLREGNPFAQDRGSRLALHAGSLGLEIWADTKLKGKWKWVFRGSMTAIHGYAIVHNIRQIRRKGAGGD